MSGQLIVSLWSGGQTGVDQGALEAAKSTGVPTSGWMPKGYLTEDGARPDFAARYGLRETTSAEYPSRTKANARHTDGTVWIEGPGSLDQDKGYRTTKKTTEVWNKSLLQIPFELELENAVSLTVDWVKRNGIHRLNVAGPRASNWPTGHDRAYDFVRLLLDSSK